MNPLSKTLVATAVLIGAIGGSYLGPVLGTMVATAVFTSTPAYASDWSKSVKAWPDDEYLLGASIKGVSYTTVDLHGKVRQASTWVGTETIQRADGTCYEITREKLRITPNGKSQRVTVEESIVSVDCPIYKPQ